MYKLLLATDQRDIQNVFSEIGDWESKGFRGPRMASSAQEAIACLEKHHVDAIAYRLNAEDEKLLYDKLKETYPDLPIFRTSRSVNEQVAILNELRVLLNRTHMDFSDEDYGIADMMQLCRNEFLRDLLSGKVPDQNQVLSRLRLLRLSVAPDKPCVLLDMDLPNGDEYLAGRWHYGSERLEVALRNFFGAGLDGLALSVAVVSPNLIRLLACPEEGRQAEEAGESLTGMVVEHVQESIVQVREYLNLEIHLNNIRVMESIGALALLK